MLSLSLLLLIYYFEIYASAHLAYIVEFKLKFGNETDTLHVLLWKPHHYLIPASPALSYYFYFRKLCMTSSLDKVFPRLHVFGNTSYNTAEFPGLILTEQSRQQDYLNPTIQNFLINLLESPH